MNLYLQDYTNPTKKLLEIINSFDKVAGYKIDIQKSVAILYINNEQTEKEIREVIPFIVASNKIKYLVTNLTEETKDLFEEKNKPLKKMTSEDGKISHACGLAE
jgi:hypothetical protein